MDVESRSSDERAVSTLYEAWEARCCGTFAR